MNISPFINNLETRLNEYKKRNNFTYFESYKVIATEGKKYFKIYAFEVHANGGQHGQRLVAFIGKVTGNIYKPASHAAPAKGVRGNVLSENNGMEAIDANGFVNYLR